MKKFTLLCATTALVMPAMAAAQSTGSAAVEDEIVITGSRKQDVGGVVVPDVPKTRSVLTQEIIGRQAEGQSILQTINLIPGVNYTNTDPYGSAGGNLRIRGFPGNRIALLWDGLPLNDTGNYAIFGNQQFDPELIDQVSVNLGTTDVDSPTPSAAGGVVSYRSLVPTTDFGAILKGSVGSFDYFRTFGMLQTGSFTPWGTRAWIAASDQQYDKFKGPGKLLKTQYNARIYQPIGSGGDFFSIAGHFNRNRNNSYNNGTALDYSQNRDFDNIGTCVRDLPTPGVADNDNFGSNTNNSQPASCTNYYNLRINPSNTGNVRGQLRLTLMDGLILTADPGYQRTLANGGGTTTLSETNGALRGANLAAGVDLNGDGDVRDTVRVYQPSNTRTNRYTFLTSLIWEVTDSQRLRVAYTFDRGEHRQTGEFGRVTEDGNPISVFGGKYNLDARIITADGRVLQNRDRYSVALLNQISGEYFGKFLGDKLTITAGIRAPFFKRELNQYCYTLLSTGNPVCTTEPIAANRILPATAPRPTGTPPAGGYVYAPFERTVKYSPILPSAGVSYELGEGHSVYASFGKNFSSPSTDNLYRAVNLDVDPETTESYEAGYRMRTRNVQAQLATYWVNYKNRIVTATDQDPNSQTFGTTLDRNVGDARAYGFDGQVSWRPVRNILLYGYASYIDSKLKEDIPGPVINVTPTNPAGTPTTINTAGAEFVETPRWQFGGRAQGDLGALSVGVQFKYVGKRYSTDDNGRTLTPTVGTIPPGQTPGQPLILTGISNVPIAPNGRTNDYTIIDADARISLRSLGLERTALKLSVINLLDKYYFGNINTQNTVIQSPRFSVGAPRTFQATLTVGF
ncbi:MAG TPA: TonB-dependent receptor [Allosphingosinicella sp.]|jgi:iron complex outermembrane receptor protein